MVLNKIAVEVQTYSSLYNTCFYEVEVDHASFLSLRYAVQPISNETDFNQILFSFHSLSQLLKERIPYSKGMEMLLGSFAFRKDNKGWERSLQTNVERTVVPEEGQRYRVNTSAKAA